MHTQCLLNLKNKYNIDFLAITKSLSNAHLKILEIWKDAVVYENIENVIESVDTVLICLPSYLHKEYVFKAMNLGKNIFLEKPMTLNLKDAEEICKALDTSSIKFITGHVLNFMEEYNYLVNCYNSKVYGNLLSLSLERISSMPQSKWFSEKEKSGSVVFDLHLHDSCFICGLLGIPNEIITVKQKNNSELITEITSVFKFNKEKVIATALWNVCPSFPFEMSYRAVFEDATIIFNSSNVHENIILYKKDGTKKVIKTKKENHYEKQLDYFLSCIKNNCPVEISSYKEALNSIKIAELQEKFDTFTL